jgi:hypothetical protein
MTTAGCAILSLLRRRCTGVDVETLRDLTGLPPRVFDAAVLRLVAERAVQLHRGTVTLPPKASA